MMKVYLPSLLALLLSTSNANSHSMIRGSRSNDQQIPTPNIDALINRIGEMCDAFPCNYINQDNLNCNRRESGDDFKFIEGEELKKDEDENKSSNKMNIIGCACCTYNGMDGLSELVKGKEVEVTKTLEFLTDVLQNKPIDIIEDELPGDDKDLEDLGVDNHPAEAERNLHRKGGRGGKGGRGRNRGDGRNNTLEYIIEEKCPDFNCTGVVIEDLNCTMSELFGDKGSRPNFMNMTQEEREEFRQEKKEKRQERCQNILKCTCCTGE